MIKVKIKILVVSALAILTISGCHYDNEEDLYPGSNMCDTSNVTYTASIAPVFATYCNSCHGGSAPNGNVKTDIYPTLVTNITRIRGAINHEPGFMQMPQGASKLPACDLLKIDIWIRQGMPQN
jgi:hypothetical protein